MAGKYEQGDEPVPGYRLVEFLGRGGFGIVWKATAPGGTEAALKIINLDGKQGLKEFRALRIVKRIRHPNLVPLTAYWLKDEDGNLLDSADAELESLETQGPKSSPLADTMVAAPDAAPRPVELVVAMGLGEQDLFRRMKECQREGLPGIPPDELLGYMEDAARAIDHLNSPRHNLGAGPVAIQHCDIKPHNIMIVGGAAQVCDLGLARVLGDIRTTAAAGSLAYGAPEYLRENHPSASSDQYSLAVSYVELKTGKLPYAGDVYGEIFNAVLQGDLDLLLLPPPEQAVIRRATSPDPRQRYPTAGEMVEALRDISRDAGRSDRDHWAPLQPAARRITLAKVALLAAAALVGLLVWRPWDRDEERRVMPAGDPLPARAQGDACLQEGKYALAAQQYSRAIDADGQDVQAYLGRAAAYLEIEDYDRAIADFAQASQLDAGSRHQLPYAKAHFLRGVSRLKSQQHTAAIGDFEETFRLDRGDSLGFRGRKEYAQALLARGAAHQKRGHLDQAVADFSAAIERAGPHAKSAHRLRGECLFQKGRYDEAIADFDLALGLDARDRLAWFLRGTSFLEKEDYGRAAQDFTQAIQVDGRDARAFSRRGTAHLRMEKLDEAIADFTQAIEIDRDARDYVSRGVAHSMKDEMEQAISDFSEAIRIDARWADAYFSRALARLGRHEFQPAIDDFTEALRIDPDLADAYFSRGFAYAQLKDYARAVEDYTAAIRHDYPDLAACYEARASAAELAGDHALAARDREIIGYLGQVEQDPADAEAQGKLAGLLASAPQATVRQGKLAMRFARQACELTQWKDAVKLDILAAACAEAGQFAEAVQWAQKAVALAADEKKEEYRSRLELYRMGKPYHRSPGADQPGAT